MPKSSFAISDCGSRRRNNQDFFVRDPAGGYFGIADGLGGLPNGERASKLALEILLSKFRRNPDLPMADALAATNSEMREIGFQLDPEGFGTTVTLARIFRDRSVLELGHVGDSAAFLARKGCLQMVTVEHTIAASIANNTWEDAGESIPLDAYHTLTQCMGQYAYIEPQILEMRVEPGDRIFLATDGVTKSLPADRLKAQLLRQETLSKICHDLTFFIEAAGSPDNYTLVAFEV